MVATRENALALFKALSENSFDSLMITDSQNHIVYVNRAFEELTGYSADEVMGQNPKLLQGAATDDKVMDRLRDCIGNAESFEGRTINYRKDGTPFIMHWRATPVRVDEAKHAEFFVASQRQG